MDLKKHILIKGWRLILLDPSYDITPRPQAQLYIPSPHLPFEAVSH